MQRWITDTTSTSPPAWRPIGRAPWDTDPVAHLLRDEADRAALLSCRTCRRPFDVADRVILAVPFRDLGERVLMGRELLVHETCAPLGSGLRVVGRGRHGEIIDGMPRHRRPGAGG